MKIKSMFVDSNKGEIRVLMDDMTSKGVEVFIVKDINSKVKKEIWLAIEDKGKIFGKFYFLGLVELKRKRKKKKEVRHE